MKMTKYQSLSYSLGTLPPNFSNMHLSFKELQNQPDKLNSVAIFMAPCQQ